MKITRRRLLAVGAAGAFAIVTDAVWIEPSRVTVRRHTIGVPEGSGPLLRVVQLSDLHLRSVGSHEQRVAKAVSALAPGFIVLTGDVVDRPDRLDALGEFLSLLPNDTPIVAVLGNWEHWAGVGLADLARTYAAHRTRLLVNESFRFAYQGSSVLLTGLDDSTAGRPDLTAALQETQPYSNHLLLAHSPAYRDQLPQSLGASPEGQGGGIGYMLSGHTHGGQIALLGFAPFCPRGSGRYVAGWYCDRQPPLYVSCGIGTSVVPVRFGVPPEIAVFDWRLRPDHRAGSSGCP
jgi:predicted MPP superfamily phosphohydrolase